MTAQTPSACTLTNRQLAWHFDWSGGALRATSFENRLSGRQHFLTGVRELALVFSAAVDRVAEPLVRVDDFVVRRARQSRADRAEFELQSPTAQLAVTLRVQLDGTTRRKWVEVWILVLSKPRTGQPSRFSPQLHKLPSPARTRILWLNQ